MMWSFEVNKPQAVEFFQIWDTYAKVVANNYMFHRELGEGVRKALSCRFGLRPFSILDLGCGDAATFAPLLEGLPVKSYRGVDLSQPALALARENLSRLDCPMDLMQADFMSALAGSETVDAIYTSFALHHLSSEGKGEFFQLCAQKLAPGGLLLVVDVNRREGESLSDYHRNYCDWLRATMTALAPLEQDGICDHLMSNDFPEPASALGAQAQAAGLRALEGARPHQWHGLTVFAKD